MAADAARCEVRISIEGKWLRDASNICAKRSKPGPIVNIETLLASGEINLSTLSAVAGLLNAEDSEALLRQIVGRTQREVDEIVAVYHAKPAPVRESVRAVAIKKSTPLKPETDLFSLPQIQLRNRQGCVEVDAPLPEPEKRFELRFSLSEKDMRDLEQAQLLLSNKYPRGGATKMRSSLDADIGSCIFRLTDLGDAV